MFKGKNVQDAIPSYRALLRLTETAPQLTPDNGTDDIAPMQTTTTDPPKNCTDPFPAMDKLKAPADTIMSISGFLPLPSTRSEEPNDDSLLWASAKKQSEETGNNIADTLNKSPVSEMEEELSNVGPSTSAFGRHPEERIAKLPVTPPFINY